MFAFDIEGVNKGSPTSISCRDKQSTMIFYKCYIVDFTAFNITKTAHIKVKMTQKLRRT